MGMERENELVLPAEKFGFQWGRSPENDGETHMIIVTGQNGGYV